MPDRKKPIAICRIEIPRALSRELDDLSKLNRDPDFIEKLLTSGRAQASDFLDRWHSGRVRFERYPVELMPPAWAAAEQAQRDWAEIK